MLFFIFLVNRCSDKQLRRTQRGYRSGQLQTNRQKQRQIDRQRWTERRLKLSRILCQISGIHSFSRFYILYIHLFILSFLYIIHSFIHSLVFNYHSFIFSFLYIIHSFIHSLVFKCHSFILSFLYIIHSFIHFLIFIHRPFFSNFYSFSCFKLI